jgi:hypothetical protein
VRVCNDGDSTGDSCDGCRERKHKTEQSSNAVRRFVNSFSFMSLVMLSVMSYCFIQVTLMVFLDLPLFVRAQGFGTVVSSAIPEPVRSVIPFAS